MQPPARFVSKYVVVESGCWEWTAAKDRKGYGIYSRSRSDARALCVGTNWAAHRAAYEMLVGPIPEGLHLDHLCRNPPCVNPAHLEPVTLRENKARGAGIGGALWDGVPSRPMTVLSLRMAAKTHCPQDHPYDEVNTAYQKDGSRKCRECIRLKERARYLRLSDEKVSRRNRSKYNPD